MKAESSDILRSAHLRNLQDEEIGTRYRILNYYLPLFRSYCKSRQLDSAQVRILDCGCGGGASVQYLSEAGFKVIGIDIAQFRRDQWKERENLPRVSFVQADAVNLPFADRTFNIVVPGDTNRAESELERGPQLTPPLRVLGCTRASAAARTAESHHSGSRRPLPAYPRARPHRTTSSGPVRHAPVREAPPAA
jgi:SAM-dependent methyltransferase